MWHMWLKKEGLEICAVLETEKGEPLVLLNLIKARFACILKAKHGYLAKRSPGRSEA